MPIYEYRCAACGHHLEALQKMSESPLRKCPECGKSQLRRLVSASRFRLKGSGWYETDFKNQSETKRNLVEKGGEPSDATAKSDGAEKSDGTAKSDGAAKSDGSAATAGKDSATAAAPVADKATSSPSAVPKSKSAAKRPTAASKKPKAKPGPSKSARR